MWSAEWLQLPALVCGIWLPDARGSVTVRSEMKKERNVWEVRLLGN